MNVLQLFRWKFYTKKLCSTFSTEILFYLKNGNFAFLSHPLGDTEQNTKRCMLSQNVARKVVFNTLQCSE